MSIKNICYIIYVTNVDQEPVHYNFLCQLSINDMSLEFIVYQMLTNNSFATILTLHIPIKNVPSKMFSINIVKACPNTLVHELNFDVLCPL